MICRKCGAKIEKGNFFCDECGQSIGTVGEIAQMAADDKKESRKKRSAVLAVAVVLAVAAYMVGNRYMNNETVNLPSRGDTVSVRSTAEPTAETAQLKGTAEPSAETAQLKGTAEPSAETARLKSTAEPSAETAQLKGTAEPTAETTGAVQSGADYKYPSDTTAFTDEFLNSLTRSEARIVRNEFYARHGLVFKSGELKSYFEAQEWYKPNAKVTTAQIHNMFNAVERKNYQRIVEYERKKGWLKRR